MDTLAPRLEDALGHALRSHSVGHAFAAYKDMGGPFGIHFPTTDVTAVFHMVVSGRCWLAPDHGAGRWLHAGDIALMPRGAGHAIMSQPGMPTVSHLDVERHPPPGDLGMLCGSYRFGASGLDPVLALLPPIVYVSARQVHGTPAFVAVLGALGDEARSGRPGHDAVVSSLVDAAFVYIVRSWFADQEPIEGSWLTALRDPGLSRSLASIHAQPAAPWTVTRLAKLARMSRASFARRFTELVGTSPLAYVTARRLDLAAQLLRETDQPLGEIASEVGYESEFALSRAFKRSRDMAPGRYRATHQRRSLNAREHGRVGHR